MLVARTAHDRFGLTYPGRVRPLPEVDNVGGKWLQPGTRSRVNQLGNRKLGKPVQSHGL